MSQMKADELKWLVRQWAARIGVKVGHIHVRDMKSKWASMSVSGRLTLDVDILDLPETLREYVIVHELVHLMVPNHGGVFKSFMGAYIPDWERRQKELQGITVH